MGDTEGNGVWVCRKPCMPEQSQRYQCRDALSSPRTAGSSHSPDGNAAQLLVVLSANTSTLATCSLGCPRLPPVPRGKEKGVTAATLER